MKPDYALSLSLDGIKFLCRTDAGWHQLGDVPLEHANLDEALKELRQLGEDHAGGDALCKIILPNDQIRYITLPDLDGDHEEAIAEALESATPYGLDELAYDFVETSNGIQIAAVAKQTLSEALEFANEHGFHAVSYTAIPEDEFFEVEPFFGTTSIADQLTDDASAIGPDDAPVFVVSDGPLPVETIEPAAPSFASTRLVAGIESDHAGGKLGGASRALPDEDKKAPSIEVEAPAALATMDLSAQETRFDPATVIAGLKRPEPAGETRPRGVSRTNEPEVAKVAAKEERSKAATTQEQITSVQSTPKVGGKPRYLGAILVLILVIFLAVVALWASLFSEDGVAGLFSPNEAIETIPLQPEATSDLETSALPPVSNESITDSAEIEALDDNEGILLDPVMEAAVQTSTGEALYAATGIWDRAPAQPSSPGQDTSEAIYLASFEPPQQTHDAIALPAADSFGIDPPVAAQNNPVAAGITFDLDESGLVVATAAGAISPEGIMVYLGKPAATPAAFPDRLEVQDTVAEEALVADARLASFRPNARPTDLVEQNERATLGGSTLSEIAAIRPKLRPEGLVRIAAVDQSAIQAATDEAIQSAADQAIQSGTDQAVLASIRPQIRPSNFASTVKKQQETLASVAVPRVERITPSIPTTASVARNATQQNAINLRKVNLIGVYGASNDRRALVRLSSGRYRKVQIGDRIDGGRVASISASELSYVKGNRTIVLKMPRG